MRNIDASFVCDQALDGGSSRESAVYVSPARGLCRHQARFGPKLGPFTHAHAPHILLHLRGLGGWAGLVGGGTVSV